MSSYAMMCQLVQLDKSVHWSVKRFGMELQKSEIMVQDSTVERNIRTMIATDVIEKVYRWKKGEKQFVGYRYKFPPVKSTPYTRVCAWTITAFVVVLMAGKELSDIISSWF